MTRGPTARDGSQTLLVIYFCFIYKSAFNQDLVWGGKGLGFIGLLNASECRYAMLATGSKSNTPLIVIQGELIC